MAEEHYNNWNGRVLTASKGMWVKVEEMLELVKELKSVKFSIQQDRLKAIDYLQKAAGQKGVEFFDENLRFGRKLALIWLQNGDWPAKMDQLLKAANYKPPENSFIVGNTNSKEGPWGKGNARDKQGADAAQDAELLQDPTERQKFEKAYVAYYTGIQSIEDQIGSMNGVFTQRHFEDHFNIEWLKP